MKITTGKYEVIEAGTVITFEDNSINIELANNMTCIISFKTEPKEKDQRLDFNSINDQTMELILVNFNDTIGAGTTAPVHLGHIGNKKLFLNFRITAMGGSKSKMFHFTWYLGEEVVNEQ